MAVGQEQQLFAQISSAPAGAHNAQPERATSIYRAWRRLSPDRRLAAVERRLSANDLPDGFPLAL